MKRNAAISILILLQTICMYGQKKMSIYELGDSIVNYETNFENLIDNWTTVNVTNAYEFKAFRYAFVETLTDSARYNYYRNFFSGVEVLSASTSGNSGVENGHEYRRFYIRPGYAHGDFYDTRGLTEKQKTILSDDFIQKGKELLTRYLNVDKMNLKHYSYENHKADTIWRASDHSISSIRFSSNSSNIASPDSISANYIDISILGKKTTEQLDTTELRRLILEEILIQRTMTQLYFNREVHLGDKVYAVRFEYLGKLYTNYVICSSKTKKVVFDFLFKSIQVEQPKYLIRASQGI